MKISLARGSQPEVGFPIMKKSSLPFLLFSVLFCLQGVTLHSQSVSTVPVGYVTLKINGSTDGVAPAFTALSAPLQKATLSKGAITADPTATVLTNANASYTTNAYAGTDAEGNPSHYIQITSGINEGLILDIVSNSATSFTTDTDFSGLVSSGDHYAVKKYITLGDIFGSANEAGLTSGGSTSSSDLVYIMSADGNGNYSTYYYQTDPFGGAIGGNGWRKAGDTDTDMSNVIVAPDDGLLVSRSAQGDLSARILGTVNDIEHSRDLPAGFTLVAYPFPVDVTLADSNIYTVDNGYVSGSSSSDSDLIYILQKNGAFRSYYYQTDPLGGNFGGNGWRLVGDRNTDASGTVIEVGSSIIVKHTGSGLSWNDDVPFNL